MSKSKKSEQYFRDKIEIFIFPLFFISNSNVLA